MVAPLVLGGLAAGSLAANIIGGELSRKAEAKAIENRRKALAAIAKKIEQGWQTADFDMEPLTYEQFKDIEQYDPELAQFIQESAPQMVREGEARDAIRAEREALQQLQELSRTGETAVGRAQREMGAARAEEAGARLRQQALDELARAGKLVGGERLLQETAAASDAAQRAREASLQAAALEEQRRQQALGQVGSLASQMRQEEMAKERTNVDIANSFNQRLSMRRQAHLDKIAQERNQAQRINQERKAQIDAQNTQLRNAMRQMERQRADEIARYRAEQANRKLLATTGMEADMPQYAPRSAAGDALSTAGQIGLQETFRQGAKAAFGGDSDGK